MAKVKIDTNWFNVLADKDVTVQAHVYTAVMTYLATGEEPGLEGLEEYCYGVIAEQISKAQDLADKRRAAGSKGGRASKFAQANDQFAQANECFAQANDQFAQANECFAQANECFAQAKSSTPEEEETPFLSPPAPSLTLPREEEGLLEKELSRESKKKKPFGDEAFILGLVQAGVEEDVARQWLKVRSKQKAVSTEIALRGIIREFEKIPHVSPTECITLAIEKSWRGFKADWYLREHNNGKLNQLHNFGGPGDSRERDYASSL